MADLQKLRVTMTYMEDEAFSFNHPWRLDRFSFVIRRQKAGFLHAVYHTVEHQLS